MQRRLRARFCRWFGHRPWYIEYPEHKVGFCWGCTRCLRVFEHTGVRPIPGVPDMVTVLRAELDRVIARLEGYAAR